MLHHIVPNKCLADLVIAPLKKSKSTHDLEAASLILDNSLVTIKSIFLTLGSSSL